eukprot:3039273-Rhodomonas_salina.1
MRRLAVSRRISTAPACASRMAASPDKPLLNALGTDQSKFHKRSDRAFAPGSSDLIVASGLRREREREREKERGRRKVRT